MDSATRQLVRNRARNRCEYCLLPAAVAPFLAFHIEHVIAQQHLAHDSIDNLALACPDYNRHKGPNIASLDPDPRELTPLFNPRLHRWPEPFQMQGGVILGISPQGRRTVLVLQFNLETRVKMRHELMRAGAW